MNTKQLQIERTSLFKDIYDGICPQRVPMMTEIKWEAAIDYCGMDVRKTMWDISKMDIFADKVCHDFPLDTMPVTPTMRHPLMYQLLGAIGIVMSQTGAMQHPEVHSLETGEYDEFIADPYKCMVEKLLPRLFKNLDPGNPYNMLTLTKAYKAKEDTSRIMNECAEKICGKYGFASLSSGGFTEAPMDFLADFIRSFSGIASDIRRFPDKVEAAADALLPHMLKFGITPDSSNYARTFIPLHMGPYLNNKQFEKFWWPSFNKLMVGLNAAGCGVTLFVEQNWMNRLEYLSELPARTELYFEYGDAKEIEAVIGKKHIVEGLFPSVMLQTSKKSQCVDKAKEILDILAPNENYIFNVDKSLYSLRGEIPNNLIAVIEYIGENYRYGNN